MKTHFLPFPSQDETQRKREREIHGSQKQGTARQKKQIFYDLLFPSPFRPSSFLLHLSVDDDDDDDNDDDDDGAVSFPTMKSERRSLVLLSVSWA